MSKIAYNLLVDLAEGRLPEAEAELLRRQVAADPAAAAELAALSDLLGLMRDDHSVDAPEHVIARAVRLMRPPAPAAHEPGLRQRIVALLTADSWTQPLAAGLRTAQAAPRSLTFSAEGWAVGMQLVPWAGRWQLRGQLIGPELAGSVTLSGGPEPLVVQIDELGTFSLPPLPAGAYTMLIQLGTREILLEPLELGP